MTRGISQRTERFTESVIREMTRLIQLHHPEDGLNLAQGFPDFAAPQALKDAACAAIQADINQYAVTWGAPGLRQAIGGKYQRFYGMGVDPEREITVCCGATEAMLATLMATVNPGEEVIVIAPFYENYWPDTVLVSSCAISMLGAADGVPSLAEFWVGPWRTRWRRKSRCRGGHPRDAGLAERGE